MFLIYLEDYGDEDDEPPPRNSCDPCEATRKHPSTDPTSEPLPPRKKPPMEPN